jgi:hypothetical protein
MNKLNFDLMIKNSISWKSWISISWNSTSWSFPYYGITKNPEKYYLTRQLYFIKTSWRINILALSKEKKSFTDLLILLLFEEHSRNFGIALKQCVFEITKPHLRSNLIRANFDVVYVDKS